MAKTEEKESKLVWLPGQLVMLKPPAGMKLSDFKGKVPIDPKALSEEEDQQQ